MRKRERQRADKQLLEEVMEKLGLNQTEIGALLGKSQSSISWVFTRGTLLSDLDRKELRRALARDIVVANRIDHQSEFPMECEKRLDRNVGPDEWMEHMAECPNCLSMSLHARETVIEKLSA